MAEQTPAPERRRIGPSRRAIAVAAIGGFAVLLWGGYQGGWEWTGFDHNDTLWDWLQLLLLPIAFATLPIWLRHGERMDPRRREHRAGARRSGRRPGVRQGRAHSRGWASARAHGCG